MSNIGFTTDNQIIRDLYNTAEEAIEVSKTLGCDGFRTYLINGVTKYVPCSSYIQYEKALRYREVQGKIGTFGSDTFGDKLVGFQFANTKDEIQGDPFFTMGNFSINKSVQFSPSVSRQEELLSNQSLNITNDSITSYTVNSIAQRNLSYFEGKEYVETLKQKVNENITAKILFDKRKLDKYVLYSSLKERFKNVLIEIYNYFPAALKSSAISSLTPTISEYVNYPIENRSEFKVNLVTISNPFGIEILTTGTTISENTTITKYRNFSSTYKDYVIYYNGNEYNIVNVVLPNNVNDVNGLRLIVQGNPFVSDLNYNNECNVTFYIKPKKFIYNNFYDNLSDLGGFLLNIDIDTGNYVSNFIFPTLNDDGNFVEIKETVYFPRLDEFNIDFTTTEFDKYTTKLNNIADNYDSLKTNLISRFLTADSLKEYDTDDRKINFTFQLYGNQFDNIKKYIDGLTYMRNVSYNKIENIPDLLIKNFAHMLGLKTYEIEDENSLIESLFSYDNKGAEIEKGLTPSEIDIELWRRILINAVYLFKSKGTRKSIEFILKLVGLPNEIFELNEYIYLVENPLNVATTLNKIYDTNIIDDPLILLERVPFDIDGYPTIPIGVKFQESGGYIYEDKNNIGEFDFGQKYINEYKKYNNVFLFDVYRTIDNVKSWVINDTLTKHYNDNINSYTEYETNNSKLIINSKELEVFLSSNRIFDISIYRQYLRNLLVVNADLNMKLNVSELTFNQYLQKILETYINPRNRKTIRSYPTLSKIYFDYLKSTNNPITNMRTLEFLNKFDSSWVKLVEQFVPATSIVNAGKKIQNSILLDNKFIYKHGLSDNISWLGTDGSEFQQKALKPVYLGKTDVINNTGKINETLANIVTPGININGKLAPKIYGKDPTINEYFGFYYTMFEYCNTYNDGTYYKWEAGIDYGDDSIYHGNINTGITRYGIFAIYNNNLYRLNTISMGVGDIHTIGITAGLPPNIATVSGDTRLIWDFIPFDSDSRNILFKDSIGPIIGTERSFYMNSIGLALAFTQIGIEFDCPPPKPHVCYFDLSGKTINLSTKLTELETYIDEYGVIQSVKQPKFYGFSKDYTQIKPNGVTYGKIANWAVPYKKRYQWISGETYYNGEIIANIDVTNKANLIQYSNVYYVTGETYTATGATYPTGTTITDLELIAVANINGVIDSSTIISGTPGGMYEKYEDRVNTDPLMHIDPAYISKIVLNPNKDIYSINLSKSLNLVHIFSGTTPSETYKVKDNIVNNQLFISDSITASFDGVYSINDEKVGPFYIEQDDEIFIHTLNDTLLLEPDVDNYVSIQSLNINFSSIGNDLSLMGTNPGYYLITKNSYLKFSFSMYFESVFNNLQTIDIKLVNSSGIIDTQSFTFSGDDDAESREYIFEYSGFFNSGDKIFLVITPIDFGCTLSRYEKIEYLHEETDDSEYDELNDPRFRVLFNSGFSGKGYTIDGISIKPIYNLNNLKTNHLIVNNSENDYTNTPILVPAYSQNPEQYYNKLFLDYYNKNTDDVINFDNVAYSKKNKYDKIDFTFKVRSKSDNIITNGSLISKNNHTIGINSSIVEYEFNFNDYYLGSTPPQTEYNNITNSIIIGKDIRRRLSKHNRQFNIITNNSYYNNIPIGDNNNVENQYFKSCDSGLNDYTEYDFSFDIISELRKYKRYISGTLGTSDYNIYQLDNDIYNNEIYQAILAKVPTFNSSIINYELNDIVKLPIENYKVVTDINKGIVESKTIYRLYVCINDIHTEHCYKQVDTTGITQCEIHEIYSPRGSRSCFVELEKYFPANFTPWGYEDIPLQLTANSNIFDYINKPETNFSFTGISEYNYGDIIVSNYTDPLDPNSSGVTEYFRFIYQKSLIWDATKKYNRGDFISISQVVSGITNYYFYVSRGDDNINNDPLYSFNIHWYPLKSTNSLFTHKSLVGPNSISIRNMENNYYSAFSATAARLPKTLPVSNSGIPIITTGNTTGSTYDTRWNSVLKEGYMFIDTVYSSLDTYEQNIYNKVLKSVYTLSGNYSGSVMFSQGFKLNINLNNLLLNSSYDFKIFATTNNGIYYGNTLKFITGLGVSPIVRTKFLTVNDIMYDSATIYGEIIPGTEFISQQGFQYKLTTGTTWVTLNTESTSTTTVDLISLESGSFYDYRIFAVVPSGTIYGTTLSFKTLSFSGYFPIEIHLYNDAISKITSTGITLTAYLENSYGPEPITSNGFQYKLDEEPLLWTYYNVNTIITGVTAVTANIPGLIPYKKYNIRAFGITSSNIYYSDILDFITANGKASELLTNIATNVNDDNVTLNGIINPGDEPIVTQGFQYKLTTGVSWISIITTGSTYITSNYLTESDNYNDYYGNNLIGKTNLYLKPAYPVNGEELGGMYIIPTYTDVLNIYPLFERLGRTYEKNNPTLYVPDATTGVTYDKTSLYLGYKYSINRGVLYKYISDTGSTITGYTNQPYKDTVKWRENDFCLVNNFTFYKDRMRVSVFEYDIQSLTDEVKNTMYFVNPNLTLKNGFTSRSFSGSTNNNKLMEPLDKFYELTNTQRKSVKSYGDVKFKVINGDIIMDYIYEKDKLGYPLTGEFMGKLKISNPCGNTACTYFGFIFDTIINNLNRQSGLRNNAVISNNNIDILPYIVRVVLNQKGESNASIIVKTSDVAGGEITQTFTIGKNNKFDKSFNIIPDTKFSFAISYDTTNNQTKFDSASVNGLSLFVNNVVTNTTSIETNITKSTTGTTLNLSNASIQQTTLTKQTSLTNTTLKTTNKAAIIETRNIILKNINANNTIFFNIGGLGISNINADDINTKKVFDVNNINIKNLLL